MVGRWKAAFFMVFILTSRHGMLFSCLKIGQTLLARYSQLRATSWNSHNEVLIYRGLKVNELLLIINEEQKWKIMSKGLWLIVYQFRNLLPLFS